MVGTFVTRFARQQTLITISAALVALAIVACDSEDAAAVIPTPAPTVAPTATPIPAPALVPATPAESGSDEEAVFAVKEAQVLYQRSGDWESLRSTCTPELRDNLTLAQIQAAYEFGLATIRVSDFSALSFRNVSVKLYSGKTAILKMDAFDGETPGSEGISGSFTKIDGQWYDDGLLCKGLKG